MEVVITLDELLPLQNMEVVHYTYIIYTNKKKSPD